MARFGDILEELRKSRRLSQAKLARALGWKQSKVSYLEALEEVPKEEDLLAICGFFGLSPAYFYDRREDKTLKALEYLRDLSTSSPEASPKVSVAFLSRLERLSREEQGRAVRLTREQLQRKKETEAE